jgi:hypothetical protein
MGNFSRDTFDKLKHYVGVRLQQGVPIVDADWNELEDIRRYELRTFLKWFVGDGVPQGNDGFCIVSVQDDSENDLVIKGGDGTPDGAGRCLVEGWEVVNESDLRYTAQLLYDNDDLAVAWEVPPLPPLTPCETHRVDMVYLDVWEREVDAAEDPDHLVNPAIGLETCVRLKRGWVVRVDEGGVEGDPADWAPPPEILREGHVYYPLAWLDRGNGDTLIEGINDLRQTDLGLTAHSSRADNPHLVTPGQIGALAAQDHELHLSDKGNPHKVTPDQIGALAAEVYGFRHRTYHSFKFSDQDGNGAVRTIPTGFAPKFVWAVAACNASLGDHVFGVSSSGHADLRETIIQQCTGATLHRHAGSLYWRLETSIEPGLCYARFFEEQTPSGPWVYQRVSILDVLPSGLRVQLSRAEPTTDPAGEQVAILGFSVSVGLLILG